MKLSQFKRIFYMNVLYAETNDCTKLIFRVYSFNIYCRLFGNCVRPIQRQGNQKNSERKVLEVLFLIIN